MYLSEADQGDFEPRCGPLRVQAQRGARLVVGSNMKFRTCQYCHDMFVLSVSQDAWGFEWKFYRGVRLVNESNILEHVNVVMVYWILVLSVSQSRGVSFWIESFIHLAWYVEIPTHKLIQLTLWLCESTFQVLIWYPIKNLL